MPIQHYITVLQDKGYVYGTDWLPHDAKAKTLATGRSVEEIMLAAGRRVRIVPNLSIDRWHQCRQNRFSTAAISTSKVRGRIAELEPLPV